MQKLTGFTAQNWRAAHGRRPGAVRHFWAVNPVSFCTGRFSYFSMYAYDWFCPRVYVTKVLWVILAKMRVCMAILKNYTCLCPLFISMLHLRNVQFHLITCFIVTPHCSDVDGAGGQLLRSHSVSTGLTGKI